MSDEEEITFRDVTVTCRTAGCANAGIAITLSVPTEPATPNVMCGVCGQPITETS